MMHDDVGPVAYFHKCFRSSIEPALKGKNAKECSELLLPSQAQDCKFTRSDKETMCIFKRYGGPNGLCSTQFILEIKKAAAVTTKTQVE